jgi:hypothetical protein
VPGSDKRDGQTIKIQAAPLDPMVKDPSRTKESNGKKGEMASGDRQRGDQAMFCKFLLEKDFISVDFRFLKK